MLGRNEKQPRQDHHDTQEKENTPISGALRVGQVLVVPAPAGLQHTDAVSITITSWSESLLAMCFSSGGS